MLLFLIVCMATAAAGGGSGNDPTRPPFFMLGRGTDSSSLSTSARELRRPHRRLVRQDPVELEATGTYKILICNVYNIFKINVLTIICLNDFTCTLRRRGSNVNRQTAVDLVKAPPGSHITLSPDEEALKFVGQLAVWFATECGIVVLRDCPMQYHSWKDAPEDVKAQMIHNLAISSKN